MGDAVLTRVRWKQRDFHAGTCRVGYSPILDTQSAAACVNLKNSCQNSILAFNSMTQEKIQTPGPDRTEVFIRLLTEHER